MSRWRLHVLPELRQFAPEERDAALRTARDQELDLVELVGVLVALVTVAAVTNVALVEEVGVARSTRALLNFLVALPMMALAVAPLHLRRVRRGLREHLRRRGRA